MYCPTCGKVIPDMSQFCMHCGNSTSLPSTLSTSTPNSRPTEWEYFMFSWDWDAGKGGRYYLTLGNSESQCRHQWWAQIQANCLPDLQTYLDKGWQPVTEVGPNGIIFRHHSAYQNNPASLELAAFRVKLRRPRTSPLADHEQAIIGVWQYVDASGGKFLHKMVQGISSAFGMQVKAYEFKYENFFSSFESKNAISGIYRFTDNYNIKMISDPPRFVNVTAQFDSAYKTLMIHDAGGVNVRYSKM